MGIVGIYGNDDSRRLMGSPSLLAMSREFDHDESAQRGKISAGGRQLPQPLGSTPPTRRPRGSQVLRDPCNSGISFRRRNNHRPKIISKRCRPGGTTPRLPRGRDCVGGVLSRACGARLRELPSAAAFRHAADTVSTNPVKQPTTVPTTLPDPIRAKYPCHTKNIYYV